MAKCLAISDAASLAMHAMTALAQNGNQKTSNKALATDLGVSEAHLAKVMQRLARIGLVSSTRGPGGGFKLDRPPDRITLLEVFEAIEGPVGRSSCLFERPVCTGELCILGGLLGEVNEQVQSYLSQTTLSGLSGRVTKGGHHATA